jgi:hypothetical protein
MLMFFTDFLTPFAGSFVRMDVTYLISLSKSTKKQNMERKRTDSDKSTKRETVSTSEKKGLTQCTYGADSTANSLGWWVISRLGYPATEGQ